MPHWRGQPPPTPPPPKVLTEEQKEKVVAWIRKHGQANITCVICGHRNWAVGDHIVAPAIYSEGGIVLGGTAYPTVMLICNHCAHTIYINAVLMGLLPSTRELREKWKASEEKKEKDKTGGK